ncbi:polysaccharide deacetylase family protein [Pseudonocardia spinosispora]|uniref:polysaccharide deacetylase family protein n=1 Tax=Pseudonocardia spinosispora TaxID=103441 RepID=UPI00041B43D1|nr:polysaccharide deacetylase [Pseudonocardia spinosispora]
MNPELVDATRPADPIIWPPGYRAAAALTFDLDAEAAILSLDPSSADRLMVMSHQAYGPLTGVPRLLAVLRRHGLKATFFVPGFTAERYPSVVGAIAEDGHEIAHHSYLHETTRGMSRSAEADMLDRGLLALERVGGIRPIGYRAPNWEVNRHTPELLIERGFEYDSSLMDCDVPYVLAGSQDSGAGDIVQIPVHWALDDWEQYCFLPGLVGSGLIESPLKALEMWSWELEAMHAEGQCFVLTVHPFASGRLGRVRALERLVELMLSLDGLWVTTLGEIAAHTRTLGLTPRYFPRPEIG